MSINEELTAKAQLIDLHISRIIDDAEQRMFERFDWLKKRGINDDDVIRYLRKQGYNDYAEQYIQDYDCIDPDVDPTPAEGGVTDPADAPSYDGLGS